MRKSVGYILAAVAAAAFFCACNEPIEVVRFTPEVTLPKTEVTDGDEFSFTVMSPTGKFIIEDISIKTNDGKTILYDPTRQTNEFNFSGITRGAEVTCGDDNTKTFTTSGGVVVASKSICILSVKLKDSSTGTSVSKEVTFYAYDRITGDGLTLSGIGSTLPKKNSYYIITSSEKGVRITCNVTANKDYVLNAYKFPGAFKTDMEVGKTYHSSSEGTLVFNVTDIEISEDTPENTYEPVKVELQNSDRTQTVICSTEVITRYPFKITKFEVKDVYSDEAFGDNLELIIETNRTSWKVESLGMTAQKPAMLMHQGTVVRSADDFKLCAAADKSLVLAENQTFTYTKATGDKPWTIKFLSSAVTSSETQKVTFEFRFSDPDLQTSVYKEYSFWVYEPNVALPASIMIADDKGTNLGTSATMYVSCGDNSDLGQSRGLKTYKLKFLDSKGKEMSTEYNYTLSVKDPSLMTIVAGRSGRVDDYGYSNSISGYGKEVEFTMKGGRNYGEQDLELTLTSGSKEKVFTLKGYVRQRCAIVIDGTFGKKEITINGEPVGWKGLMMSATAQLRAYSKRNAVDNEDPFVTFLNAPKYPGELEEIVLFGNTSVNDNASFRATMNWTPAAYVPGCLYDCCERDPNNLKIYSDQSGSLWWPMPGSISSRTESQTYNVSSSTETSITTMTDLVNKYCENATYCWIHKGVFKEVEYLYTAHNDWALQEIRFSTSDVSWNNPKLDVRYVVYRFMEGNEYWWCKNGKDKGLWYQMTDDIVIYK